eukprot:1376278-Prymnesium_polylepis.2
MTPVDANRFLLTRRKVRSELFVQRNIITFFDDLTAGVRGAEEAAPPRTMSFATPVPPRMSRMSRQYAHTPTERQSPDAAAAASSAAASSAAAASADRRPPVASPHADGARRAPIAPPQAIAV